MALTRDEEEELKRLSNWKPASQPVYERPLVSLTNQGGTAAPGYNPQSPVADTGRQWTTVVHPEAQVQAQRGYDPRWDDPDYGKEEKDKPEYGTQWGRQAEKEQAQYNPQREPGYYDPTHGGNSQYGQQYRQNERGDAKEEEEKGFWGRTWDTVTDYFGERTSRDYNPDSAPANLNNLAPYASQKYQDYRQALDTSIAEQDALAAQGPAEDAWDKNTMAGWGRDFKDWWTDAFARDYQPSGAPVTMNVAGYGEGDLFTGEQAYDYLHNEQLQEYTQQGAEARREPYQPTTRRDEDGNIVDNPTLPEAYAQGYDEANAEWQRVPAGMYSAAQEWAQDFKEGVGAETMGEAAKRRFRIRWGDIWDQVQNPATWAEAAQIPGTEFSFGEVSSAFLGAVTNPGEIREGVSPAQNIAENFVSNLEATYQGAHGGQDLADMTPEERDNVEWARLNGYSGKEMQAATYEMISTRDEAVAQMQDVAKRLYAAGDVTTAAMMGAEAKRLADMTERDMVDQLTDHLRELGPQIFFDPLNLVDVGVGLLGLGPAARRALNAYDEVMGGSADEIAEVAGELATAVYHGGQTADRASVNAVTNFFGYTAESKAAQDAGNSWMGLMRLFGGIDDKATARRLWTATVENPETLPEVLDDLSKGARSVTDKQTIEALKNVLPWVADRVASGDLKMTSLDGTGTFDLRKFSAELHDGLSAAAKTYWKVDESGNLLGTVPNLMRAIMSEQFLNTSIGHLFKNATSAVGHLVTDGQMTLKRMDDITADLMGKLGSMGVVRVDEAYGGIADANRAATAGAQALYGGPSKWHQNLRKVPVLGPVLVDADNVPRWAGSGVGGEQNFYTRAFYSRFMNSLEDWWPQAVNSQLTNQLVQNGVPPQQAQQVAQLVAAQGVKGNRQTIQAAVQSYVTNGANPAALNAMGLQNNAFISPQTYQQVNGILNGVQNGSVPLNQAAMQIDEIFNAERVRLADMMAASGGTDPARAVDSVTDDMMDAAEQSRNYRAAGRRTSGEAADDSNEVQQLLFEGYARDREAMAQALQNTEMTPATTGVFMDAWDEIQGLKTASRATQSKEWAKAAEANTPAAWDAYRATMRETYDTMFAQTRAIIDDLPVRMAEAPTDYTSTSRSAVDLLDQVSRYDLDQLAEDMSSGNVDKAIAARRQYVDYYNVDMYTTAQRLGVNDFNISVIASAEFDTEQAALRAVSDANDLRLQAKNGQIPWSEYDKAVDKVWDQFAKETRVRYDAAKQDMYRAAGQGATQGGGVPTAPPTVDEIRKLATDAGIATVSDDGRVMSDQHLLNFANKHLGQKFKSLDELDQADLLALEGKLEQRARRTAAGVTSEDDLFGPAYGDVTDVMGPPPPGAVSEGTEVIATNGERLQVKQVLDENDITTYVATRANGTEVMLRPDDIAGYRGVRDIVQDDIGEIVKINGKYYTVNEGDDIVEVYNSSSKARAAAQNTVSPTMSNALQVQYQQVSAAQQRVQGALRTMAGAPPGAAAPPPGVAAAAGAVPPGVAAQAAQAAAPPASRQVAQAILNTTNAFMATYDDILYAAVRAAEQGADFSMLNYSARRGFDTVIASVVPFHYWYTRSAKNWLERIAAHPGMVSAYMDIDQANEGSKEQAGIPGRYEGQVQVPGTDYFVRSPWRYFVPVHDIGDANQWSNPDEAKSWASKSIETAGVFGFGTFPLLNMAVSASEGDWDAVRAETRNAAWPYPVVADAYKYMTGNELIGALEDPLDPYRESRTFAAMAADKGDKYASQVAQYADQMTKNRVDGVDPMTNIPAHMEADVTAMYEAGRKEEGRQSLIRSASRLVGAGAAYYDPNEAKAAEAANEYRDLGYSYANQSGSQAAKDQYREEHPYVEAWWQRYNMTPENIDEATPGQSAQTGQYWDEYGEISDREMKDLSQALLENPGMKPSEIREFRAPYWAEKEALDEKYPDRLETSDARYAATGTKDRRRGGENPIEEATQLVIDVLAYKPPMPNSEDASDEFGWPPKYPEQAAGEDPNEYKAKQQRYYFQKELYEQAREEHATRVLDQMATEEAGAGPGPADMYADQYLLGQYVPELLRGYDARFDSPELIAVEEQWDLQGEMKGADYDRWQAEKQARLARVADEVSLEAAQAMDAYSDLPKTGDARAQFRAEHPEIYEAWDVAYDPEEHANIKATFGEDIYDLAASYTPKSRDPEGYARWKETHTDEEFQRVMSYFGYNREKSQQRQADPNADQSTQEGFTPAPNWMDVAGTQDDIRNQGAEPLGGLDRQDYLYNVQAFNPYLGYTDRQPPPSEREGPSYTDYDNTAFGPQSYMPGGARFNEVPGYNVLPEITPAERVQPEDLPPGFMEEVMASAYEGETPVAAGGAAEAAPAAGGGGGGYGGGGGGGGWGGGGGGDYQQRVNPYYQRLLGWNLDPWRLYAPNAQGRYGTGVLGPQNVQAARKRV